MSHPRNVGLLIETASRYLGNIVLPIRYALGPPEMHVQHDPVGCEAHDCTLALEAILSGPGQCLQQMS